MSRHALDPLSLMFGLVATAIGGAALTGDLDPLNLFDLTIDGAWVWPVLAIGGGLILLAATVSGRRRDPDPGPDADPEPDA